MLPGFLSTKVYLITQCSGDILQTVLQEMAVLVVKLVVCKVRLGKGGFCKGVDLLSIGSSLNSP